MKKLFLFVAAAALTLSLNSCSSDSGGGGSKVTFKVNGTKKSFKTTAFEFGGEVFVTGYIGSASDPTETVSFSIEPGAMGANAISSFTYSSEDDDYDPLTFTTNVTTNSGGKVKGTFSGTMEPWFGTANITITDGTFSAKAVQE